MSEVLYQIPYDYKFVYFPSVHDKEVHIGEQNHQKQKLLVGSDMHSQHNFNFFLSLFNVQGIGGVPNLGHCQKFISFFKVSPLKVYLFNF